ncbi:hypothetical protein PDN64_24595 [Bacillus cereus group sp. Bc256]|uniref:hypothetical protein n=1 Tax=Bacillus cereus group sp. Bc256 TaxID=3018102 RepID=UPI0022DF2911|nr:hypothetical protein [Bacillus cereus group sp. Bc256]MDA2141265.1 hypothetical protein [Bacillus cereus group sp. Bc256]
MNIDFDKITSYLYKYIDILLLKQPERTAYGIVLGVVLIGVKNVVAEFTTGNIKSAIHNFNTISVFCLGIILVRLDILFKREPLNKDVMIKLNTLKAIIKEGNFTQKQQRELYRNFIQNISSDIDLGESKNKGNATEQSS